MYKLHCLKTKLKNCLTPDLTLDIETSMPPGLPNKDIRLFFVKLVLHTFPDKEAHKRIIYEYILKLKITESNNMESFQRELRRHTIQYEAIQGTEWKKITNHVIKQYQKVDSPPFYTGFNMIVVKGPSANQKNMNGSSCLSNGQLLLVMTSSHVISGPNQKSKLDKNSTLCPCTIANGAMKQTHGNHMELQTKQNHGQVHHQE
jgi:hypothetical protein